MDLLSYLLSRKYTDNSIKGISGVLAGKNCTIESATKQNGITTVVFKWTADDGTVRRTSIQVEDGDAGESYDDTEIKQDIADIWKVQGQFSSKNLLKKPYNTPTPYVSAGITYSESEDDGIIINGTSTAYSILQIIREANALPHGEYILSTQETLPFGVVVQFGYVTQGETATFVRKGYNNTTKSSMKVTIDDTFDGSLICIRIGINAEITLDNFEIHTMLRYAEDTDDTWQPYAPTNYQLNQKLDTVAGVYLPNASTPTSKKVVASVGQTSVTFNANSFMTRYNVTASDLDLDISAETASGDIVSYNNVSVTGGIVTVTFDALAEQTTFICKCSVIQ